VQVAQLAVHNHKGLRGGVGGEKQKPEQGKLESEGGGTSFGSEWILGVPPKEGEREGIPAWGAGSNRKRPQVSLTTGRETLGQAYGEEKKGQQKKREKLESFAKNYIGPVQKRPGAGGVFMFVTRKKKIMNAATRLMNILRVCGGLMS